MKLSGKYEIILEVCVWMDHVCDMCPKWNDWLGRCDAPYWCPEKDKVNASLERSQKTVDSP